MYDAFGMSCSTAINKKSLAYLEFTCKAKRLLLKRVQEKTKACRVLYDNDSNLMTTLNC